jgi:hypothetical protein
VLLNRISRPVKPCAGIVAEAMSRPAPLSMSNFDVTWSRCIPDGAAWRDDRAALGRGTC